MPRGSGGNDIHRLVLLAAGLLLGFLVIRHVGTRGMSEWVETLVREQGAWGQVTFLGLGIMATAAGVPRQAVGLLAGYAFGAMAGIPLALAAQLGGAMVAFVWAREVGQDWARARLEGRFGHRLRPLSDVVHDNPFSSVLALRLLPVGNNLALNLLSGLSGIGFVPFLLASAIGYVPQTLIFALIGEGMAVEEGAQIGIAIGLFFISGIIGVLLIRRHRIAKALDPAAEADESRSR